MDGAIVGSRNFGIGGNVATDVMRGVLVCPGPNGGFEIRQAPRSEPAADEIEIAVAAAAVNPIDVRRAEGYGQRLLSLLGAGRFPMVLGNDCAGTVTAVGRSVAAFKVGDRVYGVKPTSAEGTHASHAIVKARHMLPAPDGHDLQALGALPYSFATMWLAVRGAGLTRQNAAGKRVLVHGAAGGLGTLSLQMLSAWGARVTATARPSDFAACREAGAVELVDRGDRPFGPLVRSFDATLNFAAWEDDLTLLGCLRDGALGHATTVHPLMRNFDELGWMRGALKTFSDKRCHRAALPTNAKSYAWTLFRPVQGALLELRQLVDQQRIGLPIAVQAPLAEAAEAFDHVKNGRRGRAMILPD